MKTEKHNLFSKIFALAFLSTNIGALMKISHLDYSMIFLVIGIISTILYIVIAINEIQNSNRISSSQKTLWTIGFIMLSFFVGLLYLIRGQKNIVNKTVIGN
jgi:threonine/homoserine/homoserine lactone efflux protein